MNNIQLIDTESNQQSPFSSFKFASGEIQVKLNETRYIKRNYQIVAKLLTSDDIMELALLVDALRRTGANDIALELPYIPYGRQDRVCQKGESLAIKVFANLINSLNFTSVITYDNHSDVATALIDRCRNISVLELFKYVQLDMSIYDYVLSPDAGANKKTQEICNHYQIPVIRANKTRSVKDGSITGTEVYHDDLTNKHVLMVDDICAGGRTFLEIAKVLKQKNCKEITLYVTHGFFDNGVHQLIDNGINNFITTNSVYNKKYAAIEVIKL